MIHYLPLRLWDTGKGFSVFGLHINRSKKEKEVIRMSISKMVVAALFAISLMITPAIADEKHGKMGEGMMGGKMKEHHKMMQDTMGMMKEMMEILRGMSHTPTDVQKKRLDEMMKQMDEMMKKKMEKHDEMMKKKMEGKGM